MYVWLYMQCMCNLQSPCLHALAKHVPPCLSEGSAAGGSNAETNKHMQHQKHVNGVVVICLYNEFINSRFSDVEPSVKTSVFFVGGGVNMGILLSLIYTRILNGASV